MTHHHQGSCTPLRCTISSDEGKTWRFTVDLEKDHSWAWSYGSCTFVDDFAFCPTTKSDLTNRGIRSVSPACPSLGFTASRQLADYPKISALNARLEKVSPKSGTGCLVKRPPAMNNVGNVSKSCYSRFSLWQANLPIKNRDEQKRCKCPKTPNRIYPFTRFIPWDTFYGTPVMRSPIITRVTPKV